MHIENLQIGSFRNYENLKLDFNKGYNIIYGDNGQGKTNILEAIFVCSSGRSHRTSKDADMIRIGTEEYYIKADIKKETGKKIIEVLYRKMEKKKVKINEIPIKKLAELMGNLNAVMFSPEDLMIIKEGPSERRKFIDITLSQIKPTYFYDLQQYNKVLHQRNKLLKEIKTNKVLLDTLEIWDTHMVIIGSRIIKARNLFIKQLGEIVKEINIRLTNGLEELIIKYTPSIDFQMDEGIDVIQECFTKKIKKLKSSEIQKETSLCGPQRDDYELKLNDKNIKIYGSQGQQRTAVLSLKLGEVEIMKRETGENPILMLDDVMSELDEKRQEYLFKNIKGLQTFITCTEKELFEKKYKIDASYFKIKKGNIEGKEL